MNGTLTIKEKKIALRQYRRELRKKLNDLEEKRVLNRLEDSVSDMEVKLKEAGIELPTAPGFW